MAFDNYRLSSQWFFSIIVRVCFAIIKMNVLKQENVSLIIKMHTA